MLFLVLAFRLMVREWFMIYSRPSIINLVGSIVLIVLIEFDARILIWNKILQRKDTTYDIA